MPLSTEEFEDLFQSIENNDPALTDLKLIAEPLSDEKAARLATALRTNTHLKKIQLYSVRLSPAGIAALADALKTNNSWEEFSFEHNNAGAAGAIAFAEALKINKTLKIFSFGSNSATSVGAIAFAEALKINKTLETFKFSGNDIEDAGSLALAGAIKENTSLLDVDLQVNEITNNGALALADAASKLRNINVHYNQIKDAGAKAFAKLIETSQVLENLSIGSNNFGSNRFLRGGVEALAEATTKSISLVGLDLYGIRVAPQSQATIDSSLQRNQNLPNSIVDKIYQKHNNPDQKIELSSMEIACASNPNNSLRILSHISQDRRFSEEFRNHLRDNVQSIAGGLRLLVSAAMAPKNLENSFPPRVAEAVERINLRDFFRTHGVSKGLTEGLAPITKVGNIEDLLGYILPFLKIDDIKHKPPTAATRESNQSRPAAAAADADDTRPPQTVVDATCCSPLSIFQRLTGGRSNGGGGQNK